jgi:spermidine synthase
MPPYWVGRVLSMCAVVLLIAFIMRAIHPAWLMTILNLLLFVAAAMIYHGELAKDRPAPSRLTEFYLCLSIGGVLGGLFNALIAPLLFENVMEYPLVMLLACALRPAGRQTGGTESGFAIRWRDAAWAVGIGLLTAGLIVAVQAIGLKREGLTALFIFAVPALMTYRFVQNPVRFAFSLLAILIASLLFMNAYERTLMVERNFFGVLRVSEDAEGKYRQLFHGNTLHGRQSIDPSRQGESLSYFHHSGPIGQVFDIVNTSSSLSVGIIGLGAGSLATYAKPTQDWTFYEINPAVVSIASNPRIFTFLKNNHARTLNIILGDARLRLQDAHNQQYDLFVLDAFSSDSIPMHLITIEALRLYLDKLANDGILAFHITNRRLDLKPVFANLAREANLIGFIRDDSRIDISDKIKGKEGSVWVVMARSKDTLSSLISDPRWKQLHPDPRVGLWTDDFSNILSVIMWRQ